jgi:hypothetical protein
VTLRIVAPRLSGDARVSEKRLMRQLFPRGLCVWA